MSRTFSLARLMLVITLFCVVCAFSVNFPNVALIFAYLFVLGALTYMAWLTVARYSRHRRGMVFVCLLGAIFGFFFACFLSAGLLLDVTLDDHQWWIQPVAPLIPLPGPAVGVLVAGGAFLLVEAYLTWYESRISG